MALQHSASSTPQTIWTLVPESQFVERVQEVLKKSRQVPEEAQIYFQARGQAFPEKYQLPHAIEYQLAQDLAFIAAYEESVHTVSAATIEETATQDGLIFNIATNSGVGSSVREILPEIGKLLEQCARKDWITPAYYHGKRQDPMHKDLKDAVDRYQRRSGEHSDEMKETLSSLQEFINFMTKANWEIPILAFETRLEALRLTGKVCDTKSSLESTFQRAGAILDRASLKTIKAFDKLANYRHIGERLSRMAASSKFRHLFKSVQFRFLNCYESHQVKSRDRFVHAEVQLATFHRLQKSQPSPRTIGTNHHLESTPETIIQTPNQKPVIADEQHGEEPRPQEKESLCQELKIDENSEYEKGAEPNEAFEPCTKAKFEVDKVDSEVPGPEGIFTEKKNTVAPERTYEKDSNTDLEPIKDKSPAIDERHQSNKESDRGTVNDRGSKPRDQPRLDESHVLSRERLPMLCAVDTFSERLNLYNDSSIETTKLSPYDTANNNADDDRESTAHVSSDYSNKRTSAVIQADVTREPSGEIKKKAPEFLEEKRSCEKRRRRRHTIETVWVEPQEVIPEE
ncbi:MAG: hypothetical protein L6R42_004396 [Xanthoria sp. 1 TBL-2021]|nr:MAG: hypothetical protein L6R42_004396 [Xanthoria sp. 1 TBL-2021]